MEGLELIEAIVINRLVRWSYWKLRGGIALGFPGRVSFIRLSPSAVNRLDPGMDMECSLTNDAFERIPAISQAVLKVEYFSTADTLKDKAALFGRSDRVYKECLKEAYKVLGDMIEEVMDKRAEAVA